MCGIGMITFKRPEQCKYQRSCNGLVSAHAVVLLASAQRPVLGLSISQCKSTYIIQTLPNLVFSGAALACAACLKPLVNMPI
jgi:hypothetical protein